MIKEIYLIKGEKTEEYKSFKERVTDSIHRSIKENKLESLKYTITDKPAPALSVIPFEKTKIAAISIWKNNDTVINNLIKTEGYYGAYQVNEVLPIAYHKNWKDGKPTPGVCMLTLFKRKKGIDHDFFIDRWHNSHTPLSLRIHPLWNYNRNVVEKTLTNRSAIFEGIVEENFRTASDLLNPFRFFGNPLIILYRMMQVYIDTKSFIDYPSMETYLTTEYHIKSQVKSNSARKFRTDQLTP